MKKILACCTGLTGANLGFLLLRFWLGARTLLAGLEKYAGTRRVEQALSEDEGGGVTTVVQKAYSFSSYNAMGGGLQKQFGEQPLIPEWLLSTFMTALGPLLIILGLLVLLGVLTRPALFVMGLLYTALTLGAVMIGQDAIITLLALHVGLVAFALVRVEDNRFTLTRI